MVMSWCALYRGGGQMVGVLFFFLEVWMRLIYTFLSTGQGIFWQLPWCLLRLDSEGIQMWPGTEGRGVGSASG